MLEGEDKKVSYEVEQNNKDVSKYNRRSKH